MATWQFDLHLLPRICLAGASGALPTTITRGQLDEEDWFAACHVSPTIEDRISEIVPETKSWSKEVRIWGQDDGHRIDVHYDGTQAKSIFVRISARDDPRAFLPGLVELCRQFDLVLVTKDLDVLPPDLVRLHQAFRNSSAFKLVQAVARNGRFPPDWKLAD